MALSNVFDEGNLRFDFTAFTKAERFDMAEKNAYGLMASDFIAETDDTLYFVEVKDYQHPKSQRTAKDLGMLKAVVRGTERMFPVQMGEKIKDSLLRHYAEGHTFEKKTIYLLLLNFDSFGAKERGLLRARISGHVPTGLNDSRFTAFDGISFDLVNKEQLRRYGIICSEITTA